MKCDICGHPYHTTSEHSKCNKDKNTLLSAEEKEHAAMALDEAFKNVLNVPITISLDRIQKELAKFNLAIQPINEKETK